MSDLQVLPSLRGLVGVRWSFPQNFSFYVRFPES